MAEENTSTDETVTLDNEATTVDTSTANPAADAATQNAATDKAATQADAAIDKAKNGADDWATLRTKLAGDDEKVLKRLSRYSTLAEAVKAGVEAQNKIGSIKATSKPGDDATPEELAAYRAANGIPESADKYEINLPNGMVLGDVDQPFVDSFRDVAHKHHLSPAAVNDIAAAQLELRERETQARAARDVGTREEAREKLSSPDMWGSEVDLNVNLINGLLDTAPKGVKEQLLGARMADGTPLGNNVGMLQFLNTLARDANPMATVVPGSGSNAAQALEGELDNIKSLMGDRESAYWKGPKADKMQQRFRELTDVQMKMAAKG